MHTRLLVLLLLIVALPLGLLSWFGMRLARDEREASARRVENLMEQQAEAQIIRIPEYLRKLRAEIGEMLRKTPIQADAMRTVARENTMLTQLVALDPMGEVIFPQPAQATSDELDFLRRSERIWSDKELIRPTGEGQVSVQTTNLPQVWQKGQASKSSLVQKVAEVADGWHAWHWENGLHVLYWTRDPDGTFAGAELDSMRLLSEIIELLPEAVERSLPSRLSPMASSGSGSNAAFALVDAAGQRLHQWGGPFMEKMTTAASVALPEPLASWRVEYLVPENAAGAQEGSAALGLGIMIAALGIVMAGMAFWFYREHTRQMRLAGQRVSFVNQVSHELKTPLTNIRMYAELMDEALGEAGAGAEEPRARQHLNVIVNESRRLSRLIGNILTFSRKQRNALELHMKPGVVDDTIRAVAEAFGPSLEAAGMKLELELGAPGEVMFDADVVEQILGNLISNAEKYAAAGGAVRIRSRNFTGKTTITVSDDGPGIASAHRKKIFEPFYRISDRLTDGVAGTGIGLTLARDLAAMHGGTIELVESEKGACFEVSLGTVGQGGIKSADHD